MAVDTSIWVASIASVGVVLNAVIQGRLSRSLSKGADEARIDEREQDRVRREEDREADRVIREEEHAAALRRQKDEAEANTAAELRRLENIAKARVQDTASQFVRQAEKCLFVLRRADRLYGSIEDAVTESDWGLLATTLGDVVLVFDRNDGQIAREAVRLLREASVDSPRTQLLDQAESHLVMF